MDSAPAPAASHAPLRPLEAFSRRCQAVWATSYTVDLPLINKFLLPQLGDAPLNLTVLADQVRLAATLSHVDDPATVATVNRRWLVRGVGDGRGAFHPKSYLFVTTSGATLLVGSGNLSSSGLADGKETFHRFDAGTAVGDAAIRDWLAWLKHLIGWHDDPQLRERYADLRTRLRDLVALTDAPAVSSPLLHNLHRPLAEQLRERLASTTRELLLTAPFYDEHGEAAGALVDALRPGRVQVFAADDTSVDGAALAARLTRHGADLAVWRYTPVTFVHAKLIGGITDTGGWLLSGSANLSHAALHRVPRDGGNVELGVLTDLPADAVRATFQPPQVTVEPWSPAALAGLTYDPPHEPTAWPVTLHRLDRHPSNRVALHTSPAYDPNAHTWWLTDGEALAPVHPGDSNTSARVDWPHAGRLVWLCDEQQTPVSGRAVIDEPDSLTDVLHATTTTTASDQPRELHGDDADSPLGTLLMVFHRHLIMDVTDVISDTRPTSGADAAPDTDAPGEDGDADDDLWERLARDTLTRDPRASRYQPSAWTAAGDRDPLVDVIALLRDAAPAQADQTPVAAVVTFLNDTAVRWHHETANDRTDDDAATAQPARRWSTSARHRVRLRNALRRWADAQSDARLHWLDPAAPMTNLRYALLLLTILRRWRRDDDASGRSPPRCPLDDADLDDLAYRWLATIVGTGEGDGWLARQRHHDRDAALDIVDAALTAMATTQCWIALGPGPRRRDRLIRWQPVLHALFDAGLVEADEAAQQLVRAVTGDDVDADAILDRLIACHEFLDDDLWRQRTIDDLHLTHLTLDRPSASSPLDTLLWVGGITDPLTDARTVRLVLAARRYFPTATLGIFADGHPWRLVVPPDAPAALTLDGRDQESISTVPLDTRELVAMSAAGATLRSRFPTASAA